MMPRPCKCIFSGSCRECYRGIFTAKNLLPTVVPHAKNPHKMCYKILHNGTPKGARLQAKDPKAQRWHSSPNDESRKKTGKNRWATKRWALMLYYAVCENYSPARNVLWYVIRWAWDSSEAPFLQHVSKFITIGKSSQNCKCTSGWLLRLIKPPITEKRACRPWAAESVGRSGASFHAS